MLRDLFERCLYASYVHTAEGGDFALQAEGDTLYILFECSVEKEDWINNFSFPAKPYKSMDAVWLCHGGFLKVWKAMRDDIEAYVADILASHDEIHNIKCVGYSHGGAIAVFATEDMAYLYGDKYSVEGYGFGAPRVLWGLVPKSIKERLSVFTTIRNIDDIVTHVPPRIFGFRNCGHLTKVGVQGKYNFIDAHRPESYLQELIM